MTDWRSLRGSNFLAPEDLERGPALVTIVAVKGEEMLDDDEKIKKEVALTITARHRNTETGLVEDLSKTEWIANVVNLTLLEALFGTPHIEQWVGRKALLQQEPCEVPGKFLGKPSVRVAGGPDIDKDLPVDIVLRMKGGKKRKPIHKVLHPTRPAPNVNPTTGEVGAGAASQEPPREQETAQTAPPTPPQPEDFGMDAAQSRVARGKASGADDDIPLGGITPQQREALDVQWRKLADAGWEEEVLRALLLRETGKLSRATLTVADASKATKALAFEVRNLGAVVNEPQRAAV